MQKEDGSEGFCNSCGYAWGEGGYEISDERKLEHLRIAFTLLQEGARKAAEKWHNKQREALDLFAVEQAKAEMYKRQMEAFADNYSADEQKWKKQSTEPYVVHITRREFLELPISVRRHVLERQTRKFLAELEPLVAAREEQAIRDLHDQEFDEDYS